MQEIYSIIKENIRCIVNTLNLSVGILFLKGERKVKFKKTFSWIAALSVISTSAVIPAAAASDAAAPVDYVFNLTFDEAGTGSGSYAASEGGTVKENGNVLYAEGKEGNALSITSKAAENYLSLPDGILSGKTAATYSFWLKPGSDTTPNWPFMTTSEESHEANWEKYVGMLATTSAYTVERYNNSGERISSVSSNGNYSDWKYVTVVVDNNSTNIYVNGIIAASDQKAVDLSGVFTADSKTWIGHANWGSGEGFQGMIDEFRIYDRALSEDEIIALAGDEYDKELENILSEYNRLDIKTNFYNGEDKIFQYSDGEEFTVKTTVENLKPQESEVEIKIAAYNSDDAEIDGSALTENYTLSVKKTAQFEKNITVSADAEYYKVTVTENKGTDTETSYDAGRIIKSEVVFPDASPEDTFGTTYAAHDPSIFKDPETGIYYAYNTDAYTGDYETNDGQTLTDDYPMDTFMSTDLVHWERIDNNFRIPQSAIDFCTEIYEPMGSHMNTGVWAPDIFYAEEDTEHPYWLYYSLSTNGTNYDYIRSAIGLVKGESPTGPWEDCGIVISSTNGYNTNAIDSNIYVDTNGDRYFVWGSFQKGVHQVKLTEDGRAEGVNYTSNATIHDTSKKVGTRLFATPGGIMGPEGAYMVNNEEANYRYMFTSYGWLGTNYNIRVARNSLDNTWASETSKDAHHKLLDHMGRKVGTSYSEQSNKTELWGYKMLGSYQLGDGLTYYGNGHNSVLHDNDGNWYLVEHCRKQPEGYAVLQVRKMLWTDEGWPVVSPLVYAGEGEQVIPVEMLYGTWDLSSVGQYITENGASLDVSNFNNKQKVDLPVLSSEIIIQPDGTLGNGLGTWEYDGDHTITFKFTKDGDQENNQYFRSGDTMKLFVLTGYDKDKRESAIVMTGTDQNSITQLAKKSNASASTTGEISEFETTPIVVDKSIGGNPSLGFDGDGNIMYAGDPAALVDGDTVYIYAGHDTSQSEGYRMPEWVCYSSKDMVNWKYEGVTMSAKDISWRVNDTTAWASQVIKYNNKYYMYYCTTNKNANKYHCIGVAVSDSPTGPFVDKGEPVVNGYTMTPENTSDYNDIDPTVWVETVNGEEHRYLAWGNNLFYVCELNEDMMSVNDITGDGTVDSNDVKLQEFTNLPAGLGFTEAPWIYRRTDENGTYTGKYYMFGAFGWREQMGYATSDSMYGPWEFGGILMPPAATSNTNHPSVIDFNGKTYFIYHNGSLPWGSGFRRVVCVEEFTFNDDGSIDPIQETSTGLTGTRSAIMQNGGYLYYENFINPSDNESYPITKNVYIGDGFIETNDTQWEIVAGKADTENENYVSIQAVNKPGLYLAAQSDNSVVITQDANQNDTAMQNAMTFKTVKGLNGEENAVSFESVLKPGYFLANVNGKAVLVPQKELDTEACSFEIGEALESGLVSGMLAEITDAWIKDGTSVKFYLSNADKYKNLSVYAAEYDKTGALIGVSSKSDIKINSLRQSVEIPYERKAEDSTIKVFVWSDMLPAAESAVVTATESPYKMPEGYTSYFSFDEDTSDSISGINGTYAATNIEGDVPEVAAVVSDGGYSGKAMEFTGANSYGLRLGNVITNSKYTIAFRMKANEFTQFTSALFIDSGNKTDEKWVSAPFGDMTGGATKIWSKLGDYMSISSSGVLNTDTWHQVVIAADGGTASLYIDGAKMGTGNIADIITSDTVTYLGVNYWDTPFNGLIDEVYIYNGTTLDDTRVTNLYEATNK